jgi:hypothetical protein
MNTTNNVFRSAAVARKTTPHCGACFKAGKPVEEYTSHWTRALPDISSPIVCPFILSSECGYCHESGHWTKFCPHLAAIVADRDTRAAVVPAPKPAVVVAPANSFQILADDDDDDTSSETESDSASLAETASVSSNDSVPLNRLKKIESWSFRAAAAPVPPPLGHLKKLDWSFPPLETAAAAVGNKPKNMIPVDWSAIKKNLSSANKENIPPAEATTVTTRTTTPAAEMAVVSKAANAAITPAAAKTMPPMRIMGFIPGKCWADYSDSEDEDDEYLPTGAFAAAAGAVV